MQRYVDVLRDEHGRAVPNAEVRVYIGDSSQLAPLYDGAENSIGQPLHTDSAGLIVNGTPGADGIGFKVAGGRYRLEAKKGDAIFVRPDLLLGDSAGYDYGQLVEAVNQGVYADTAAGLAATSSGEYFSVPAATPEVHLTLYRNDGDAATEVNQYPSAAALTEAIAALESARLALETHQVATTTALVNTQNMFLEHTGEGY